MQSITTIERYHCFNEVVALVATLRYYVGVDLEKESTRVLCSYSISADDWLSGFVQRYVAECTKHRHDKAFKPTRLAHILIANCALGRAKRICG